MPCRAPRRIAISCVGDPLQQPCRGLAFAATRNGANPRVQGTPATTTRPWPSAARRPWPTPARSTARQSTSRRRCATAAALWPVIPGGSTSTTGPAAMTPGRLAATCTFVLARIRQCTAHRRCACMWGAVDCRGHPATLPAPAVAATPQRALSDAACLPLHTRCLPPATRHLSAAGTSRSTRRW